MSVDNAAKQQFKVVVKSVACQEDKAPRKTSSLSVSHDDSLGALIPSSSDFATSRSHTESPKRTTPFDNIYNPFPEIERNRRASEPDLLQNEPINLILAPRQFSMPTHSGKTPTLKFIQGEHQTVEDDLEKLSSHSINEFQWGKETNSIVNFNMYMEQESQRAPKVKEKPTKEKFVKQMLKSLRNTNVSQLTYLIETFSDLVSEKNSMSTLKCMLASDELQDEICYKLLALEDHDETKILCQFLYTFFTSESPVQRLFALQFLPVFIWLLWTQELKEITEVIACLHGLYLREQEINSNAEESSLLNSKQMMLKEGVGIYHNLFPEIRMPENFASNVYHRTPSQTKEPKFSNKAPPDSLSSPAKVKLSDLAKIDELLKPLISDFDPVQEGNFPRIVDNRLESFAHCFPLIEVALQLYVFYVDRLSQRSLQQFCAVVGKICSPVSDLQSFDFNWKWNWEIGPNPFIQTSLPSPILHPMLDVIAHCIKKSKLHKVSLWVLDNVLTGIYEPAVCLRAQCLFEIAVEGKTDLRKRTMNFTQA